MKMIQNNLFKDTHQKVNTSFLIVPEDVLDTLVAKQDRILELLEAKKEAAVNGYITEKQAIEKINKKATWFWQMRKTGQLPFKKIGQTIYYLMDDIDSLLQS
jgi:hypothetical protein